MIALAVVGTLLVTTLNSFTAALKTTSEIDQLRNVLNQVAAKASELITVVATTNSSTRVFLQMPSTIGYKQYWLQARNDSSSSWIQGSFGNKTAETSLYCLYLPKGTSASGQFLGGYGPAVLESYMNGSSVQVNLDYFGGR